MLAKGIVPGVFAYSECKEDAGCWQKVLFRCVRLRSRTPFFDPRLKELIYKSCQKELI